MDRSFGVIFSVAACVLFVACGTDKGCVETKADDQVCGHAAAEYCNDTPPIQDRDAIARCLDILGDAHLPPPLPTVPPLSRETALLPTATPDVRPHDQQEANFDPDDPAYALVAMDHDAPTNGQVLKMQRRFARLRHKCPVKSERLVAQFVDARRQIKDETDDAISASRLLTAIERAIPGKRSPFAGDQSCRQVFAAVTIQLSS